MHDFERARDEIAAELSAGMAEDPMDIAESAFEDEVPEWLETELDREREQAPDSGPFAGSEFEDEADPDLRDWDRFDSEREIVRAFYEALAPDDTVWVYRGFTGLYAMFAAKRVGPDAVTAFEFEERFSGPLVRNLRWVGAEDVGIVPYGLDVERNDFTVGDTGETVHYYPAENIPSVTGDVTAPTVVLLDALGAEWPALEGFSADQLDDIRELFVAVTETDVEDAPDPAEWLDAHGFEVTVLAERPHATTRWDRFVRAENRRDDRSLGNRLRSRLPF